jgi:hypothetical protein
MPFLVQRQEARSNMACSGLSSLQEGRDPCRAVMGAFKGGVIRVGRDQIT